MSFALFAQPAGAMLRSAFRPGMLGVRAFSMSRAAGMLPATASYPVKQNKSQLMPVAPLSSTFQNMPVAARHASTAIDTHGAKTWKYFRYGTLAMFAMIPVTINAQVPAFEYALSALISLHAYWGLDEVITDYIHPTGLQSLVRNLWRLWVSVAFCGMLYFTYNDVGIIKAIGLIWSLH